MEEVAKKQSYFKALIHTAKYPLNAVNGFLLGKKENNQIIVYDSVPFLHTKLSLSPSYEFGLPIIDNYAVSKGYKIVGYYYANENLIDVSFSVTHKTIFEKVKSQFSDAILWRVRKFFHLILGR